MTISRPTENEALRNIERLETLKERINSPVFSPLETLVLQDLQAGMRYHHIVRKYKLDHTFISYIIKQIDYKIELRMLL